MLSLKRSQMFISDMGRVRCPQRAEPVRLGEDAGPYLSDRFRNHFSQSVWKKFVVHCNGRMGRGGIATLHRFQSSISSR